MFELVKKISQEIDDEGETVPVISYSLTKDEVRYQDVSVIDDDGELKIIPSTIEMSKKLLNYDLFEFPIDCSIIFKVRNNWNGFNLSFKIRRGEKNSYNRRETSIFVSPILRSWKHFYSFEEFSKTFIKIISTSSELEKEKMGNPLGVSYTEIVGLSYEYLFGFTTLSIEISRFIKYFDWVYEKVIETIKLEKSEKNVLTSFDFPEYLKIPCEQYLLYFAGFLKDLGINVTSSLKEEAGKVLFSVTPTDDIDALDKIREALAIYLNLPSSPVLYNDSFQSMQLKQQVENLQHAQRMQEMEMRSAQYALRLAQQNIENQDKIITQQNSFIDNQNKIIEKITSKSIMIDSLENKEELEKFCEGFEVGKSEFLIKHFGLHLNPATVLKNLGKKIVGKEEEIISILDSDEEAEKNN